MSEPMKFSVVVAGVGDIECVIPEDAERDMLRDQWRYEFDVPDLGDRDKLERMVTTQLALAFDKGRAREGVFILDGADGRKWFVPNEHLLAVAITPGGAPERGLIGFRQLSPLVGQDTSA